MDLTASLYGVIAALSLGTADFIARFTTRRFGPLLAAVGMLAVGSTLAAVAAAAWGVAFPASREALLWTLTSGVASASGMMMFYWALSRGQVAYVIPLAATYPIWSVAYGVVFQGLAIDGWIALAMAATLCGAWIIAAYGRIDDGIPNAEISSAPPAARATIAAAAILAGFCLVATIYLAAPAAQASSDLGALASTRAVALAIILTVLLLRGGARRAGGRTVALLALQGALDAAGVLALIAAAQTVDSAIAVVISSAFGTNELPLRYGLSLKVATTRSRANTCPNGMFEFGPLGT